MPLTGITYSMRRRLEKNNLGFLHVFSANLSYILFNILYRNFPIYYIRQVIAQIRQKCSAKRKENFLYII